MSNFHILKSSLQHCKDTPLALYVSYIEYKMIGMPKWDLHMVRKKASRRRLEANFRRGLHETMVNLRFTPGALDVHCKCFK